VTRRLALRLALAAAAVLVVLVAWFWVGLPARSEVRALSRTSPKRTRLMEQRAEEADARGRKARVAHSWVPLSRVSRHLIHAVLSSEDQGFFGHQGVDWKAIEESIERNVERGRFARGGSTITQQLAKNLYFGTSKTLGRKARELVVTRWLEADLPKARILALYLNLIEWGDGVYGCQAGARHWYGKSASELSVTEAAGLAAMIPNPRRLNPRVNLARHERATRRVLWLMGQAGYIGRDVAGLGAEPPPETVAEDEEPADSPAEALPPEASPSPPMEPSAAPAGAPEDAVPSSTPTPPPPPEDAPPSV
jgi:monofunctional biosynthetic peptidoglycan transglycosylase